MINTIKKLLVAGLILPFAAPAMAGDNDDYGETRFNSLPLSGMISKNIWVGSWWAYKADGIAYRHHDDSVAGWNDYKNDWNRWDSKETSDLSPAEKFDKLVGRLDKVEYDQLIERGKKLQELDGEVKGLIDERRDLVRVLRKAIKDNADDGDFDWQTTDDGKRYKEINELVDAKHEEVNAFEVNIDTATEYEVLKHGSIQFGVGSWFGHCNAWAAAAIVEPEPRQSTTVDGIEFTAGDVKAFLTEIYMESDSIFHGTRNNYHEDEESRDAVDFKDISPAMFHIFFADQIGNRDKSFVIDRFTGDEVWNQPVKAYRADCEPLYTGTQAMEREVSYTTYPVKWASGSYQRIPNVDKRPNQQVYPLMCSTTIHWITDGLPSETLTALNISDDIDDETFKSSYRIGELYDHQVEIRTISYELWLDKPMDDPDARIIGDGSWEHGSASNYTSLHPDFIWQPTGDVNDSRRDYENEFIDGKIVREQILPGTLEKQDDPMVTPEMWTTGDVSVEIVDNDVDSPAIVELEVDADVTVAVMTVDVDITHTYIGDLQVRVVAPSGRSKVIKRFGAGRSSDDIKKTFDVKALNGEAAKGTWRVEVRDRAAQDVGTVNSITLHIK